MTNRMGNQKQNYQFIFNNNQQDRDLEKDANLGLVKLLSLAPPKARASGVLQGDGDSYVAMVEISSPFRSFEGKAYGLTPRKAVQKVLEKLEDKLYQWRFGGNSNGNSTQVYQTPQVQG